MAERVRLFKRESAATGGDPADDEIDLTPIDPNEDFADVRGINFQNDTSNDEDVAISRDSSDNLTLKDGATGPVTLSDLVTDTDHPALRQLIHLADSDGPMEGFVSGAYLETLPAADIFPTSFIWYTDSGKTDKIVEETVTYNANMTIATDQWKAYDTDGSTVLVTITDTIAYTDIFETSRTRVIT